LRFEFEPTGTPDLPHGRGAPGRLQLYLDDKLVGDADTRVTAATAADGRSCSTAVPDRGRSRFY
jgi:hypothetical protein